MEIKEYNEAYDIGFDNGYSEGYNYAKKYNERRDLSLLELNADILLCERVDIDKYLRQE